MKLSLFVYTNPISCFLNFNLGVELELSIILSIIILLVLSHLFAQLIIMNESKKPNKLVFWLALFALWPILSVIMYLLFGYSGHKRKLFKEKHQPNNILSEILEKQKELLFKYDVYFNDQSYMSKRLAFLTLHSAKAPLSQRNEIRVLTNGEQKFVSLFEDLKNAQNHIHLEYYIFRDDELGNELLNILINKVKAGVEVRVIFDALGCHTLSKSFIQKMRNSGIEVHLFFPLKFPHIFQTLNYRNHRKLVVIDGEIGYLGGLNVGNEYISKDPKFGFWRDTHLRLVGESVQMMQITFLNDWYFLTKEELVDSCFYPEPKATGEALIQILAGGPDSWQEPMKELFFTLVETAQKEILLTTPYFIPDESMMMALKSAALSGLKVVILVQGIPDHQLPYLASATYFEELLKSGIEIYRYMRGILHNKVLIIDQKVSLVGSANFDIRSFQVDFELSALIYSSETAKRLYEDFLHDLQDSTLLDYREFSQRKLWQRIKEANAALLAPML